MIKLQVQVDKLQNDVNRMRWGGPSNPYSNGPKR